jgi:type IV secretory pathway VirB4 component
MGSILAANELQCTRLDKPFEFSIQQERLSYIKTGPQSFSRVYTLYNMSKNISATWINNLFNLCGTVNIGLKPIPAHKARRVLISHASTLEGRLGKRYREEAADARYINDLIQKQETVLYQCTVTATVTATTKKELDKRCKEFEKRSKWAFIRCMAVKGKQKDMLLHGWGNNLLFDLGSCAVFYPFESSDLIESDGAGGVYLGTNEITGAPVIYDYLRRVNANMTIIGESGRGKSTTAKTYIDNFLKMIHQKYGSQQRVMICIIDPHGEYTELAAYFGCDVIDLTVRDNLGLDPFVLMPHPDQAVAMISEVVSMPEDLKSITISRSEGCTSIKEMLDNLHDADPIEDKKCRDAAAYLAQFATGGLSSMFAGDIKIKDRIVFSMRKASKNKINAMLISMAMQKMWRDMQSADRHIPKLFVIDEGWFVVSMDSTGMILKDIAKSGRKENVHLIFLTQEPEDVLSNEHGKSMIENSDTIMFLGLKANSAASLQHQLHLSDEETRNIESLMLGHAMLRAGKHRIKLAIKPTEKQLELFNTSTYGFK